MFPEKKVYFTDMGRSAFRFIVEKLQLQNSQMLIPSYICDIFLPILKDYNISPVFLDIEKESFNINPDEIEQKIMPQTKSILVSHTYGLLANLEKILPLARKYNLKVIEDCAHSLGATKERALTGNFGDAALFSLYKLFPTLRGGMAVLSDQPTESLDQQILELPKTRFSSRDFISLLNCFSFFSFLFKKYASGIAVKNIREEKLSRSAQLNRVSFNIFSWQFKKLEKITEKRKELGCIFQQELKKMGFEIPHLKETVPTNKRPQGNICTFLSALIPKNINRDNFVKALRKKGVFSTRIWHTPIVLNSEAQKKYNINISDFPITVKASQRIVNFPFQNFYTKKDIEKIIEKIKSVLKDLN